MNSSFALPGAVAAALVCFGVVVWQSLTTSTDLGRRELRFLLRLVAIALALRLVIAIWTYMALPYGSLAPDEVGYAATGLALSKAPLDLSRVFGMDGWNYFDAASAQLFGDDHLLPRLWNAGAGSLTALLGYVLAAKVVAPLGARLAALMLAFMPSLVLWSALNLKDADVWCLILAGLILAIELQRERRWRTSLGLALAIGLLGLLRQFAAASMLIAVVVGLASPLLLHRRVRVAAGAVIAAVVLFLAFVGDRLYERFGFDKLAAMRHAFAIGARSAVDSDPGLQTFHGVVAFLPRGLVDFLLRPFPWEVPPGVSKAIIADFVLYYLAFVAMLVGIYLVMRTRPLPAMPIVAFLLCLALGYSLVIANLGTSYRERAQIVAVMSVFVGGAFEALWPRLARSFRPWILAPDDTGISGSS